jgi:single-strand DNA-binding protein
MAGSVNKVILIGNLGRDPEVRHAQDGTKIVNLNIATSENWKDKNSGERKEKTEWHRVVVFNDRVADVAERYLKKGSKVYIEGALQTRKWTDQSGVEKYSTEIVISRFKGELTLLDGRGEGGGGSDYAGPSSESDYGAPRSAPSRAPANAGGGGGGGWEPPADLDDEIPF